MRVVDTDNFGGDYPNEKFVTEVVPEEEAKCTAYAHNHKLSPYSSRYWKVVPDTYVLQPGFEP